MTPRHESAKAEVFNADVLTHGGYLYSTNAPLSSRLAHSRISDAIMESVSFRGKTVIDIGCGDGVYTLEILGTGQPARLHGTDLASAAVGLASHKPGAGQITFDVASAYALPFADGTFDIAHLRAVLHHMDHPELAIQEALRVARAVVVAEPNGNNPGVKLFERFSAYHRAHQEKSYSSPQLTQWVTRAGGKIARQGWIGLVPTFCPDWLARLAKRFEPLAERIPLFRVFSCSIYVFVAEHRGKTSRMGS
jgi:ubiquinone/menaquinone biosynthesis C-methylase UbiE